MSQQSTAGRSGRLPLNSTKFNNYSGSSGGADDGVTVKTLSSASSSYPHSSRKLYSSKDEQGKHKRESNTKWSGGRNGEIVPKTKVNQGNSTSYTSTSSGGNAAAAGSSSSAATPTISTDHSGSSCSSNGAGGNANTIAANGSNNNVSVSSVPNPSSSSKTGSSGKSAKDSPVVTTGNKKDTSSNYSNSKPIAVPHASTYNNSENKKRPNYYENSPNQDIEVRTRSSNNSGRRIAAEKFSSAQSKSERSSTSTVGGLSPHHSSRISGRLYPSEKYRNNDTRDFFRRIVPDPSLGKLLNNAVHDDTNQTHSTKLLEFITDRSNYRTVVKYSQILWESLLQLLTADGKLAPRAASRRIFITSFAQAGTCSIDAQSRYPESEGGYRFYQWLFEKCNETGCDSRISLLAVLHEVILDKSVRITIPMAQYLVGKLHTILDSTGDIEELFAVLKIVMHFAHHHHEAFAPVFADVVDILAGWSVDPEQTDNTISRIADILISLQPYWVEDMPMCVVMTNNFQDDLQTMTRDILDKDREPLDAAKIALLIRLLQTSVRAVGDQFNHEKCGDIHPGFVCECMSRMITSLDNLTAADVDGLMPAKIALVDCIGTLAGCGEDVSSVPSLTPFIIGQSNHLVRNTIHSVVVWLVTLSKLYKTCRAENLLPLTNHFLTLDLTSLKLSSNREVQCAALDLHRGLFATKDPDTVQVAFKNTKEQIELCLAYLTGESRADWSSSRGDIIGSKQRSQQLILFHLSSLTHVATDTNSLIFMYTLEPSIFNFLLKDILLVYGSSLKDYSSVNYHLIALLHLHCNSHKNFIEKSNLCAADTTRRGRHHMALNKSNGDNFSVILESMAEMFSLMRDNSRGLKLLTRWVCEITEQVATLNPPLLNNIQLVIMMTNVLSLDDEILVEADLLNIADALAVWVEHSRLTANLLSTVLDYTMYQLSSQLPAVRRKYLFIITKLPVDSVLRAQSQELMRKHNQALALRRSIMSGSCGSLNVEQFRVVASILFKQYTSQDDLDQQWLKRLLITAEKPSTSDVDKSSLLQRVLNHSGLLEHWLLWQTADFCVAHRLRTPIGKPLDTFMCIEAAIKQISADTRVEVSPKCQADSKRVWLLLQFMENLEKALYNAYEGTAVHLTTHGKVVRSFFRTNKGTCIEWLTRIRLHILSIASTYGHPTTVIRHGYELITDMLRNQSTQTPEFELVLVYMTEAWCQLNCSEAIQGLYEWCKAACNRKLTWLKPFFLKAMNRYEESAPELRASLSNMLSPPALGDAIKLQTRPNPYVSAVTQLTAQQITDCYTSLQSWDEASDWLKEFDDMKSTNSVLTGVSALGHCDKVLMANEEGAGTELLSWSKQQHLTQLWMDSVNVDAKPGFPINEDHKLLRIECSSDWPAAIQPGTLLTLLSQRLEESTPRIGNLTNMSSQPHCLPWLLKLSKLSSTLLVSADTHTDVLIKSCREARNSGNLKLAHSLMSQLPKSTQHEQVDGVAVRIAREAAKQVYSSNNCSAALQKMSTIALHPLTDVRGDNDVPELVARSTLTVVKWLQSEPQLLHALSEGAGVESAPSLYRFSNECSGYAVDTPTIPQADKILGAMLQKSTEQCSSLAKTWYCFGNWAYKWGRKCLDNAEQSLSAEEIQEVEGFLPNDVTLEEKEEILAVMSMVQGTFTSPDEDLADDSPDYGDDDLLEIRRRLISCCPSLSDTVVEELVKLWTRTARRAYTLYEQSAIAYFSYLNMCSTSQGVGHHNVTITLRLLRLLVKHAWELRDVLEAGLKSTPTAPWRNIIPQLFSRLNHPELYVTQSVSELLARLADDYPHLIVYPAIVGCNQSAGQLDSAVPYIDDSADAAGTESAPGLTDCFQQLVETLSSVNPNLIKQVRTLVNELCRITVLWDELWLGSLNQLAATASERIKALASEVERVKNNSSLTDAERSLLIREKRETIAKPLIHAIERLSDITGKVAETKHEQWFQETYNHLIERGLDKLTNPAKDEDLTSDWQPFKQLHVSLQQRSQKRSSHILKMKDLSNVLASLTDTYVPLPGAVAKGDKQPITLQSVYPTLQILPTKTKPKKLAFLGSDGQKYYYLFKGLEDLHLDERIMQLLNIVNDMLVPKETADSDCVLYRARNYSVTPLGLRSGLIAWVDGCLPLFSLYKRWQLREAAAQAKPNGNSTVSRPSEMLYSKLLPLLKPLLEDRGLNPKEVKMSDVEKIRKEWPLPALVTATKQLIAETPSHLVAKEIWCQSTSANEWWGMTKTYCRSVAVMSAIGYILGLGDRHLDNLLLDPNNGEMVHIDYNVCFDKGKSLRVPERVPFRLTNNIVAAMGATGVEGMFRSACEHTIKSMRLGKETLLTLLEAFVYDPLVDWTVGGETGLAGAFYGGNYAFGDAAKDYRRRKKQMERDITRSMFSIRVTEMKSAWLLNKEEMATQLTDVVDLLNGFITETMKISSLTEQAAQCREILKYIEELKKEGGQAINRLVQRFAAQQKLVAAKEECVREMRAMSDELTKYTNLHQAAIKMVTSPALQALEEEIAQVPALGHSPGALARPFMQTVGQLPQLDLLEQYQDQLVQLIDKRTDQLVHCKQSLARYGSIVNMFPSDQYASQHVMGDCLHFISLLEQDMDTATCEDVARLYQSATRNSPSKTQTTKALNNERALQGALSADIEKLARLVEKSEADEHDIASLVEQYKSKQQAIDTYRSLHGDLGHRSLMFIVLPKLAEVTKRCLALESTANKSGDRLHYLTSRDGDWFLDELSWVTDNMVQYVALMQGQPDESSSAAVTCSSIPHHVISGIHKVYTASQDMLLNFQQVILPDTLMSLVKGEQSVHNVINSLASHVIKSHDLEKLCNKLDSTLRNMVFGAMEVDSAVASVVGELRSCYKQAFLMEQDSGQMSKGSMLCKVLNGLFEHVYKEYTCAMHGLASLDIPKSWRKVDIIRYAGTLQLSQYNENTMAVLGDLFFVKQLIAMKEFYSTATQYINIFKVGEQTSIESYDALSRPLKTFIADFVRKQLLGVASQSAGFLICDHLSDIGLDVEKEIALKDFGASSTVSIDDLCKKGLDRRTQTGTQLSQANALISNFETCWKKQDVAKRQLRNRLLLKALVTQQKRYMLCYQWLHEDLLSANQTSQFQPTRKEVLTDLHRSLSALMSTNSSYSDVLDKLTSSENAISQRLKWAAGANPKLTPVLLEFEKAQNNRAAVVQKQSAIVKELNTYCHSILHLETMRTKSQEAANLDSRFKQLLNRCLEVCKALEEDDQLSELPHMMISLMSKADRQKTGNAFLGRAHDATQSHLSSMGSKMKGLNKQLAQIIEKYKASVSNLQQGTLNAHHKLISEVRAVLKTLAKEELEDPAHLGTRVQDYLADYKVFSEKIANVVRRLSQESMSEQLRDGVSALVADLQVDIEGIFTRLIDSAKPLTLAGEAEREESGDAEREEGAESAVNTTSPMATSGSKNATSATQGPAERVQRDPKTGKAVQERNSYAVSVWRRVKMKLDGRELDPNKKMSVTDQVSYVISEATDVRNLAQMYEGWTSWV